MKNANKANAADIKKPRLISGVMQQLDEERGNEST